ncbi:hypothetical protein GCM10027026_46260 [Myroides odoratimimus subsp. xuanwuensis]
MFVKMSPQDRTYRGEVLMAFQTVEHGAHAPLGKLYLVSHDQDRVGIRWPKAGSGNFHSMVHGICVAAIRNSADCDSVGEGGTQVMIAHSVFAVVNHHNSTSGYPVGDEVLQRRSKCA